MNQQLNQSNELKQKVLSFCLSQLKLKRASNYITFRKLIQNIEDIKKLRRNLISTFSEFF